MGLLGDSLTSDGGHSTFKKIAIQTGDMVLLPEWLVDTPSTTAPVPRERTFFLSNTRVTHVPLIKILAALPSRGVESLVLVDLLELPSTEQDCLD